MEIKSFLNYLIAICWLSVSQAQFRQDPNAGKILSEVSASYKKMAGFLAEFTHESQSNTGKINGTVKGSIIVSGSMYRLKTGSITIFCDGKTVWTADSRVKEVSIAGYSPEADDITPERVYTFYQKGYKYMFAGEVKNGKSIWQSIDLEPENLEKEISKIRLFVDKSNRQIRKWIVYERGSNDREEFLVDKFQVLKTKPDKDIRFNQAAFPGYKLVDLR